MATITPQSILTTGSPPVFTAVNASDSLTNNGNCYLHVKNTNAAACTVTVDSVTPCNQGFDHDLVVVVPATTGEKIIGPFPVNRYGGAVAVTYSVTSGVTAALVAMA